MIICCDLPPGFSTVGDEHFVYLVHAGEKVSRFSSAGATVEAIEEEARGQYRSLNLMMDVLSVPGETDSEKCVYDHLHDLFDEAGLSPERRVYWDALIGEAVAREFGECTNALEEYAAEEFAEFLSDPAMWIGGTDGDDDIIGTGWAG
jgi:hypothetical protein